MRLSSVLLVVCENYAVIVFTQHRLDRQISLIFFHAELFLAQLKNKNKTKQCHPKDHKEEGLMSGQVLAVSIQIGRRQIGQAGHQNLFF